MLLFVLSSHFTNSLIPTCDSYKCCGVAVLRCCGCVEEKKKGGELESSEKGCIFAEKFFYEYISSLLYRQF